MKESHLIHPVYIDSNDSLKQFAAQWSRIKILSLDTEFIRTNTFYPIAGLLQLSDGETCYLIDPLVIDDFTPLAEIFSNKEITKLIHSGSEDLEVFDRLLGVLPEPLLDTQIGAALAGLGFSLSYQRLVDETLQIHVAKGETRSDWLQRPLTEGQIHYAALDVAYLHDVYSVISGKLEINDRLDWWQQEGAKALSSFAGIYNSSAYYKKVKSAWKLDREQLCVLKAVTQWRENEARSRDIPRGRVIKDRSCFDIALKRPQNLQALSHIDEMHPKSVRRDGQAILDIIAHCLNVDESQLPQRLPRPLPPAAGTTMKRLKAFVKRRAEQLDVASEMLVRKRDFEQLLRNQYEQKEQLLPETLLGWRKAVIGDDLLKVLTQD